MTEFQARVLADVMMRLGAAGHRGRRLIDQGATLREVREHLDGIEGMILEAREAILLAEGAGAVLDKARAKPLSGSARPRPT